MTKAETLDQLAPIIKNAVVLPQIRFTIEDWQTNADAVMGRLKDHSWLARHLIVRSSGISEDSAKESLAGHFVSIPDVKGESQIKEAVGKVIASFGARSINDQVFIQPMLLNIAIGGVAFTRDPNTGGNYFVVNYDDHSGSIATVTSGQSNRLRTFYYDKTHQTDPNKIDPWLLRLISLLREIEELFASDAIDIEFAVDKENNLYLLQVRPLIITIQSKLSRKEHGRVLSQIIHKIKQLNARHPYVYGERTVFGVMPDWNPAEMIGIRPRPFALSLYKEMITDNIWAYMRDNYGYMNLRSFPLLINFGGLPYIDVRISFNSFIPSDINPDLADRLVNYYIDRLVEKPSCHDKVEFEILFSCYTLDLPVRLKKLLDYGFCQTDCDVFADSLRNLTNKIIHGETGLWRNDITKIAELERRQKCIDDSGLDTISKIYWLLEDCKRYGTLPFAGLARAGFIAVQLLQSLIQVTVLTVDDYENFMRCLNTVGSQMSLDFVNFSKDIFLKKYGHLRPGTYDVLSPRYDEEPDRYFNFSHRNSQADSHRASQFSLSLKQLNLLESLFKEHRLDHNVISFFNFIKSAIEGREYSKFVFSRSISDAINMLVEFSKQYGISREEISYADISVIHKLYSSSDDPGNVLRKSIEEGKRKYEITQSITLPSLITDINDVFFFELPVGEPNFITLKSVAGKVITENDDRSFWKGNILMIPSADPGYDWIFTQGLGGFITMYGGANSHMAIRAGELGIPAVIGAGEVLYRKWMTAKSLHIDCAKHQVQVLQ